MNSTTSFLERNRSHTPLLNGQFDDPAPIGSPDNCSSTSQKTADLAASITLNAAGLPSEPPKLTRQNAMYAPQLLRALGRPTPAKDGDGEESEFKSSTSAPLSMELLNLDLDFCQALPSPTYDSIHRNVDKMTSLLAAIDNTQKKLYELELPQENDNEQKIR